MIRPKRTSEWSIAAFLLGFLAITPPILSIFSTEAFVFGIPLLYLYLFCAWAAIIALIALIADFRNIRGPGERADEGQAGGRGPR
jgi:hypothetical protein